MDKPSKSQVRKAGSTIRAFQRGEVDRYAFDGALHVVSAYSTQFVEPLAKVNEELLDLALRDGFQGEFTSRLKRQSTIVEKLSARESQLSLDRMVDIAGNRFVLKSDDLSELRCLERSLRIQWDGRLWEARCKDYVSFPRESGYRAIHIVVWQDELPVEIQLRTARMHDWAQRMESLSYLVGRNFKQDGGSTEIDRYGRLLSLYLRSLESDASVDSLLSAEQQDELVRLQSRIDALEARLNTEVDQ